MSYRARFEHWVASPVEPVFRFFTNPENLPRIMPPATATALVCMNLLPPPGHESEGSPIAGPGSEIVTSFRLIPFLPFRLQWAAVIADFEWNHHFADEQRKGPFKSFRHLHEVIAETREGRQGTIIRDVLDYEVGFGFLGQLVQRLFIGPRLRRMFAYRQKAVVHSLEKTYKLGSTTTAVP